MPGFPQDAQNSPIGLKNRSRNRIMKNKIAQLSPKKLPHPLSAITDASFRFESLHKFILLLSIYSSCVKSVTFHYNLSIKAFTTSSKGIEPIWSISLSICVFRLRVPMSTISTFCLLSISTDSTFSALPGIPAITSACSGVIEKPLPPSSPPFVFPPSEPGLWPLNRDRISCTKVRRLSDEATRFIHTYSRISIILIISGSVTVSGLNNGQDAK